VKKISNFLQPQLLVFSTSLFFLLNVIQVVIRVSEQTITSSMFVQILRGLSRAHDRLRALFWHSLFS
jgi:hypothetical protein